MEEPFSALQAGLLPQTTALRKPFFPHVARNAHLASHSDRRLAFPAMTEPPFPFRKPGESQAAAGDQIRAERAAAAGTWKPMPREDASRIVSTLGASGIADAEEFARIVEAWMVLRDAEPEQIRTAIETITGRVPE